MTVSADAMTVSADAMTVIVHDGLQAGEADAQKLEPSPGPRLDFLGGPPYLIAHVT
jgi:hypothetical protein